MKFLIALLLALASAPALAVPPPSTPDPHCSAMDTPMPGQKGQLCIYPGDKNADVLYYLHGKDESADLWGSDAYWSKQIRDYWKSHGEAAPTVVAVSLGQIWLLGPKTKAPAGFGAFDLFVGKLMPAIEAKLGGIKGRRLLLGDSMGGFNALQLGMKTDLFVKVAALCAPMGDGTVGPFSSDTDVEAYIRKSTAFKSGQHTFDELKDSFNTIQTVVGAFWTADEWPASDPIEIARSLRGPRAPKYYLAAGFFDHYLTYEGNVAFADFLAKSGTSVEWRPQWGDHCAIDVPSLSEFLVQ
jgi:hypothetical protein